MSNRYSIGSITSGYRPVQNGDRYNVYFPTAQSTDEIIIEDGEVEDTVDLMKKVVWRYLEDTKKIAPILEGKTLDQTCRQIWNFLYHHIQYKLDKNGLEQLRRPARSWADRSSGIDCDCFSIFASSILTNLQIPHSFRITKYGGTHFQHVYVVVNKQIIIDPVLSRYNYEKPFTQNKDFPMNLNGIDVAVLSGTSNDFEQVFNGFDDLDALGEASEARQLDAMYAYLVSTRNAIANQPRTISQIEDPRAFIQMLDYAIQYWHTDKRTEALEILAQNEDKLNLQNGFSGFDNDDGYYEEDYGLGKAKRGFFKKVGDFAQKVGSGIKQAATKAVKAVVKFNPLSLTARLGFLAAMKINLKKMASKLKWAYATQAQAASKGISASEWNKSKAALQKVERLFADKLQGDRGKLRDAILKGRAGGLNGVIDPGAYDLSGLGEPVSIAASIAAATPIIASVIKILKDMGLFQRGEDTSTENLQEEAAQIQPDYNMPMEIPMEYGRGPMYDQTPYVTTSDGMMVSNPAEESTGVMAFVKKNPLVVIAGVGIVGFGAYKLMSNKKKASGLSGTRTNKRRVTKKRTPTKRRRTTTRRKIQRVNLK